MNKKIKYLVPAVFVLWCFLLLIFTASEPAMGWRYEKNPDDVPAGTLVTTEATDTKLEYDDVNDNLKTTEEGTTITDSVEAVYGLTADVVPSGSKIIYLTPGVTNEWYFMVSNEGNAEMSWTLSWETTYGGGTSGTGWHEKWFRPTDEVEVVSGTSYKYLDNTYKEFDLRIYASTVEANSPDGSYASVTFYIIPDQVYPKAGIIDDGGTGLYYYEGVRGDGTGDKEEALGGFYTNVEDLYTGEVQAPLMMLTRISTVDAPDNYRGDKHDVVPGSLITFMLFYDNTGAGAARDVVVIDKVPDDTEAYKFDVQEAEDNINVTASKESDYGTTGWYRYYTTSSPPSSFDYDGSGADHGNWILSGSSGETTMEVTSTYVKWERATVEASENKMLQWSVTVK